MHLEAEVSKADEEGNVLRLLFLQMKHAGKAHFHLSTQREMLEAGNNPYLIAFSLLTENSMAVLRKRCFLSRCYKRDNSVC